MNIKQLEEKIRYYFDVSSDKKLLLEDILKLIRVNFIEELRETKQITEQNLIKHLAPHVTISELKGDLSEYLYGEDDRGSIFRAGYLLGTLEEKQKILGEDSL